MHAASLQIPLMETAYQLALFGNRRDGQIAIGRCVDVYVDRGSRRPIAILAAVATRSLQIPRCSSPGLASAMRIRSAVSPSGSPNRYWSRAIRLGRSRAHPMSSYHNTWVSLKEGPVRSLGAPE